MPAAPVSFKFVNVNAPELALLVTVPPRMAPAEVLAVIEADELATLFPETSCISTVGCVVKLTPLTAPTAGVTATTFVGAPNVSVNVSVTLIELGEAIA